MRKKIIITIVSMCIVSSFVSVFPIENVNAAPYIPNTPHPADGSTDVSVTTDLSWSGGGPDDPVTYDVYFGTSNPPQKVSSNQTAFGYTPSETLSYNTLYYWKIVAWDSFNTSASGLVWSFTTATSSNQPPNHPSNPTPSNGSTGVSLTATLNWVGGDPDGNPVKYDIYFGTSTTPQKVSSNQTALSYTPPETLSYNTLYYWRIVAWDSYDESATSPVWRFTTVSSSNNPPIITNIYPANESSGVSISSTQVRVSIQDPDGDPFDWSITGPYVMSTGETGDTINGLKTADLNAPLPYGTEIVWNVHVRDPSGSGQWINKTYHFTTVALVTLKWSKNAGVGWTSAGPLAADVNNDGEMDIIRTGEEGIAVLDGATGTIIDSNTAAMYNDHCPAEIIDLNKDGVLEIITSHENGTWALHGDDLSTYWYNPAAPLHNKYCVAGDIGTTSGNNFISNVLDGYPEVFVCTSSDPNMPYPPDPTKTYGSIHALTHDGYIFAETWTYYPCFGGLTVGDTDYDGIFELYQGDRSAAYHDNGVGRGCVSFWASNLTVRWSHPEMLMSSSCPTLVDVNNDGKLDVVCTSQIPVGFCVYDSTTGENISVDFPTGYEPRIKAHSQTTVCDVDNDGHFEVITCRDWSKPIIWDLVLRQVDAWLPYDCFEPPAVADVDGDGNVEIIACAENYTSIFKYNEVNNQYQLIQNISINNPGYGMAMIVAQDVDDDGLLELVVNRGSSVYVYDTMGHVPTPPALSQFNFYSQHRGRAPFYTEYIPPAPIVKNEQPTNGSYDVSYNPQLSIHVFDYQHDSMTITFRTNASTGIWHTIMTYTNKYDGTYTADTTGMDIPRKDFWWSVTVTDSTGDTTYKLYKFRTISSILLSAIKPADHARNVELNPQLSIDAEERTGHLMTIQFLTNASGNWVVIGSKVNVSNGTYTQKPTTMSSYNKKYYWNASCFDGQYWINETFEFTTRSPGGGSSGSSENTKPIADVSAGEPYQGVVNSTISFNGSKSYDADGTITKWFWVFGDDTNGTGKTILHSYSKAGAYSVTLMVTDDDGATHTDTTTCVITHPNRPPTTPLITGPTNGTKNTLYTFTAISTDADHDSIQYALDWGDPLSFNQLSGFLPNGSVFTVNHSWPAAGRYDVTVTATDNQSESSAKITVYIDAVQTGDIGYLLDNSGDTVYDAFYSDFSKQITAVQRKDDTYHIDSNGDGNTDYIYSTDHGLTTYQAPKTPGFELVFVIGALALALFLRRKKLV